MLLSVISSLVSFLSVVHSLDNAGSDSPQHNHQVFQRHIHDKVKIATQTHTTIQHIGIFVDDNFTSYFYLSLSAASWPQAQKHCQTVLGKDAHLIYVKSEHEFQSLGRTLLRNNLTDETFWTGGLFNPKHNNFEWADGTPFYERIHWDTGYPDSTDYTTRVILWHGSDLKFRTAREVKSSLFICELDLLNEN